MYVVFSLLCIISVDVFLKLTLYTWPLRPSNKLKVAQRQKRLRTTAIDLIINLFRLRTLLSILLSSPSPHSPIRKIA